MATRVTFSQAPPIFNKKEEEIVLTLGRVVVSNLLDGLADDPLVVELCASGDFSQNHDHAGLGSGLAGNLAELVLLEAGIKNGVRHLVADLVCWQRKTGRFSENPDRAS